MLPKKAQEIRIESALIAARAVVCEWNPQSGSMFCAGDAPGILGIQSGDTDLKTLLASIHHPDREAVRRVFDQGSRSTGEAEVVFRCLHADGNVRWVKYRGGRTGSEEGSPRVTGVFQDVTLSNAAHQDLSPMEQQHRNLLDNLPQIIWLSDEDGVITYFNRRWWEYTGLAPTAPSGLDWRQRIHPEDLTRSLDAWGQAMRSRTPYYVETRLKRHSGDYRWHLCMALPLRTETGEISGWVGSATDIQPHRELEDHLRNEKQFTESIIDSIPGMFYIFDSFGAFLRWNQNFEILSGYSADELSSRTLLDFFEAGHRQNVKAAIEKVFAIGRAEIEADFITRNCRAIPFIFTGVRVAIDNAHYLIGVGVDLAERRRLEDQLRQVAKMDAVGRLAGGIAHDFNNLLTAILGYSAFTLDELGSEHQARSNVEEIERAANRAASLTHQLLAFSRKQMLQPKELNLNTLILGLVSMLRRLIGETIELRTVLDPGIRTVKADPGQFEQVLVNLVLNARDAMPRGGLITIETANVNIDDQFAGRHLSVNSGPHVMTAVIDTGAGMDRVTQAKVFDPFFTTKDPGKGTGLGLSMVHGIVKQSGGDIWLYSEPGQGATFKVFFPAVTHTTPQTNPVQRPESPRGSETVMLVEDDDQVREFVREVLERCGYKVLDARSPTEALHLGHEAKGGIDLLITDVVMPGSSGRELAQQLQSANTNLRVLYMSGYTDDAVVSHGVLTAGSNFLQKPFAPSSLARQVRRLLDEGIHAKGS